MALSLTQFYLSVKTIETKKQLLPVEQEKDTW